VVARVFIVKINRCFQLVCQTSQVRQWSSCTVPSVRTSTCQSLHVIITRTVPTLAPAFLTCSSWSTRSTGQSVLPISLYPGCMDSKFTQWRTSCSTRPQPPSRPGPHTATQRSQPPTTAPTNDKHLPINGMTTNHVRDRSLGSFFSHRDS